MIFDIPFFSVSFCHISQNVIGIHVKRVVPLPGVDIRMTSEPFAWINPSLSPDYKEHAWIVLPSRMRHVEHRVFWSV